MAPAPISLAWGPGEALLASAGGRPSCNLEARPVVPTQFLSMFFAGHLTFTDRKATPQQKSQRYRTIILSYRRDLQRAAEEENDKQAKDMILALTHAHTVWHFIEAVFLTDHGMDDRHTSESLTEWYMVNYHANMDAVTKASYRLEGERPRDDDDELWDCMLKLAIVGKIPLIHGSLYVGKQEDEDFCDPASLVSMEDKEGLSDSDPARVVKMVYRLMDRCPGHNISARSDGSWDEWQATCAMWADSEELENHSGARKLLGLIGGDPRRIAEACATWEELLVAFSTYGQYGVSTGGNLRGGYTLVTNACSSASAVYQGPQEIAGGALLEAALGHIDEAIVCMDASLPSSWFAAHLCDLLISAGQMDDKPDAKWGMDDDGTMGMREYYLKQYARGLERYRGCWRIAVDYYTSCLSHGMSLLIDMLSRIPFEGASDPTIEKVLGICTSRKLQRTRRNICERLGADCLNQQNLGGAMAWFTRAGLQKRAQGVAGMALTQAETEGPDSQAARALECVVCALTSAGDENFLEMFDYLRVYCRMQQALNVIASPSISDATGKVEEYASLLISSARRLVSGGGLPRRHWAVVAYEIARVIDGHPELVPLFSRAFLSEVLGALQLTSGPHRSQELVLGLRRRLAFEANRSESQNQNEASSIEEAEDAVQSCRAIFIRTAASRITAD